VRMLPADAAPAERAVVSVSARRGMDYEDFALAPGLQSTGPGPESSPPGTVALSFGDGPPAVVGKASAVPMGL